MLELRRELEKRIDALGIETEALEVRLLELSAEIAREGFLPLFPEALAAAGHVDLARLALDRRSKTMGSEGKIGQNEPPPIPPAGEDMKPRRRHGKRPPGGR